MEYDIVLERYLSNRKIINHMLQHNKINDLVIEAPKFNNKEFSTFTAKLLIELSFIDLSLKFKTIKNKLSSTILNNFNNLGVFSVTILFITCLSNRFDEFNEINAWILNVVKLLNLKYKKNINHQIRIKYLEIMALLYNNEIFKTF